MSTRQTLEDLARSYGVDKLGHGYIPAYEAHFGPRRDRELTLLEIGIGGYKEPLSGGHSLMMWRDYFPLGRIIGVDVHEKRFDAGERVTMLRGNQGDREFLQRLAAEHGPFDIIIDDGSHINAHRNLTFRELFPHVSSDGVYVLEDLHTSYWKRRYGGDAAETAGERTTMGLLKGLVDGLNYEYIPLRDRAPFDDQIVSIAFYSKIAFVFRGNNKHELHSHDRDVLAQEVASRNRQDNSYAMQSG